MKPIVFIHIPKCAGTSFCDTLEIPENKRGHGNLKELKMRIDSDIWNKYKKITIIRNPFERLISTYSYRKQKGYDLKWIHNRNLYGQLLENQNDYTFEDWFWNLDIQMHVGSFSTLYKEKVHWPSNFNSCYDLMLNDNNDIMDIDYVIRFENLNEDLKKVFGDLNLEVPKLPNKNSTKHKHYSEYFKCPSIDKKYYIKTTNIKYRRIRCKKVS